jgi:hypothetical protein
VHHSPDPMPADAERLRATVEHLAAIERPSASAGERRAAEWIRDELRAHGLAARVEEERAHGTYWVPLGLMTAGAGVAGLAARSKRGRAAAAIVGGLAAAGIVDDVSGGPHVFRRVLPHRTTYNVVAEGGDPQAERTLLFVAHHDAAHGGAIFTPILLEWIADRYPDWYERQNTSPQVMQLVAGAPAVMALGSLTGIKPLRALGAALSLVSAAAFADIAARRVVPGANDNLTGVAAILELARLLAEEPARGVRVMLVSTGSEESFMEGMRAFGRRHFSSLPRESTRIVCLDSVGSPQLILIEGEGMIRMRDYPRAMRDFLGDAARRAGVPLRRGLRLGLATDALIAMKAGYQAAGLGSVTKYKFPSNYHSQRDTPPNVDYETARQATEVCHAAIRLATT